MTTPRATVLWTGAAAFVVRLDWRPRDGQEDQWRFQAIAVGDDRIRKMADYRTLAEATRAAKRFAAPGNA
jgi:hypothetical protein